jgi:RNA polymerase sigma-70 factor (ECF subfamily)
VTANKARILDAFLVAAARTGDRRALGQLVERWNGKLLMHAWRLTGDGETARDAVQASWVEIVRGLDRLADERAFAAWAYRIASRRCARLIGEAVRYRAIASRARDDLPPPVGDPGAGIEASRLRQAIAALPPAQRSAIALFYLEDMSVAEVAVALDVPAGTVKTRLLHARLKLREALKETDDA